MTIATVSPAAAICIEAHKHASKHRAELDNSALCGCFFCFRTFQIADVTAWTDANQTALCPRCGVDAVLGSASGHTIDDRFLRRMHQHHFSYRSR